MTQSPAKSLRQEFEAGATPIEPPSVDLTPFGASFIEHFLSRKIQTVALERDHNGKNTVCLP
ncbi:hypothetical protein FM996_07615 [Methylosinus sporium]|uniref:Uncharacterized protein n=1 Tax=Methylosinus sporium TaxID=428 RepID=A0A549T0K9_METSR|nr:MULTISPECIES: hypothetical protein [Methylosinus]MBU3886795.1 hypothetical protein [Methylosinus sp. KRF6]TRL35407.1 hypothetical protein FM996_07615 [Methylosinus sporium]